MARLHEVSRVLAWPCQPCLLWVSIVTVLKHVGSLNSGLVSIQQMVSTQHMLFHIHSICCFICSKWFSRQQSSFSRTDDPKSQAWQFYLKWTQACLYSAHVQTPTCTKFTLLIKWVDWGRGLSIRYPACLWNQGVWGSTYYMEIRPLYHSTHCDVI